MSRSSPDPHSEQILVRVDDVDPWGEFLSESSDELQVLKTELVAVEPQPAAPGSSSPPAGAATESQETAPSSAAPDTLQRASDVHAAPASTSEGLWFPARPVAPEPPSIPAIAAVEPPQEPMRALPPAADEAVVGGHLDALAPASGTTPATGVAPAMALFPRAAVSGPGNVAAPPAEPSAPTPVQPPRTGMEKRRERSVKGTASADSLSLAHLLARHVPVKWSEAVATIEELCSVLVHQAPSAPIPSLQHIMITPAGDVHINPGSKGRRDTATLGRLLHSLLAATSTPIPLRLFVTSSIASARFESVELYAEALSYYALPNRNELIAALCRRALETPPSGRETSAPTHPAPRASERPGRRRAIPLFLGIAAAVILGVAGIAGAWFAYATYARAAADAPRVASVERVSVAPAGDPQVPSVVESAVRAPDSGTPGSVAPVDGSRGRVPPRPSSPRSTEAAAASAAAPPAPLATSPVVSAPLQQFETSPSTAPARVRLPALDPGPTGAAESPPASAAPAAPAGGDRVAPPPSPPVREPGRVYSSADAAVEPPQMLPREVRLLPPALPDAARRVVVELLIDEQGAVQSATVVGRPQRWDEMAMLSALKNQRYRPAMKDGTPVSYRLRMQP